MGVVELPTRARGSACVRLKQLSKIAEATIMNLISRRFVRSAARAALAMVCVIAIGRGNAVASILMARPVSAQVTSPVTPTAIPADQLDSLVAPIALYPDPLLAQTLAASTYPLEIMQLHQFLQKNPRLTGQALANAVAKQPWDPSVQAMAAFPDVVKRMAENIQWMSDLGNAVVSQESAVMDAVQRMRVKAEGTGQLQSTPQQVVETRVVENKSVVVIEPASTETIYVPSYNPVAVYGPAVYPYPSMYYPSYYGSGAYWGGRAVSFGLGVAAGAFWGNGGWGWNAGWGRGDITVNRMRNTSTDSRSLILRPRATCVRRARRRPCLHSNPRWTRWR